MDNSFRDDRTPDARKGDGSSLRSIDLAGLSRAIRADKVLGLADEEAEALAQQLEASKSDEEFLANALAAVRFILGEDEAPLRTDEPGESRRR